MNLWIEPGKAVELLITSHPWPTETVDYCRTILAFISSYNISIPKTIRGQTRCLYYIFLEVLRSFLGSSFAGRSHFNIVLGSCEKVRRVSLCSDPPHLHSSPLQLWLQKSLQYIPWPNKKQCTIISETMLKNLLVPLGKNNFITNATMSFGTNLTKGLQILVVKWWVLSSPFFCFLV